MKIPFLNIGDLIAVTAPASQVKHEEIVKGVQMLNDWGFQVKIGSTVGNAYHDFSATREERLKEFQSFLDNPKVRCIIAARGGYGISDIVDQLNFSEFKKYPKWIIGFSDITAMLLHMNKLGYKAIHGPMVKTLHWDQQSADYLRGVLTGNFENYTWNPVSENRHGEGEGMAVGGNLALIAHSVGSQSDFDPEGKILFLEDIGEKVYNVDRMMVQLKRAGKLKDLSGLVVGDFSDSVDSSTSFGKSEAEIILDHTSQYNYPVAFGLGFGHEDVNWPVIMGQKYKLKVNSEKSELSQVENAEV